MKLITQNLVQELQTLANEAVHICWITAFAMKSGVQLMLPTLEKAHAAGCEIQLLVGDYLSITQPDALKLLQEKLPNAELRMYRSNGRSFHPKAYLFRQQEENHVIVGSSNLSRSALTTGVEWSLHTIDRATFEQSIDEFHHLFYAQETISLNSETIAKYRASYEEVNRVLPLSSQWDKNEETELMYGITDYEAVVMEQQKVLHDIKPRPAQQLALQALQETVDEGYTKALAVLATGLGKTYLAAFFARKYKRVLFIAHRDEILQQANYAFSVVFPDKSSGYFRANEKDEKSDLLFASIHTLSQKYHLQKFQSDDFDLIIVDEFHHAAAPTYQRVLAHFNPQFLLGITATPDRLDHKDVYSICDGNVAIEIHFLDAIVRDWLSPFHYYGIKDEIDYSQIRWLGNYYDDEQLAAAQIQDEVAERILQEWMKYKQTRTIAFCSSIKQAYFLCEYFLNHTIKAAVLTGGNSAGERKIVRQKLMDGLIDIIFTVDLFNEGVDIPLVDTLLFARPTESLAIFTQQIGRGLRLADSKTHCVIIDFIGNYRNADRKLRIFKPDLKATDRLKFEPTENIPMTDCILNFSIDVINLLEEMRKKSRSFRNQIIDAYQNLKLELGNRPSYLEMHLYSQVYELNVAKEFGSYVGMLKEAGELSESEQEAFEFSKELLVEIEKTGMTKSYKMVLLKAMLQRGKENWFKAINVVEVAPFFKQYLSIPSHRNIDPIELDIKKVESLIRRMPMTKWAVSSKGMTNFQNDEFSFTITIPKEMQDIIFNWVEQICEYRLHRYFERKAKKIQ